MEKEKSSLKRKISGNDDSSKRNRLDASEDNTPGPRVFLTVSSLDPDEDKKAITKRQLELNWFDAPTGMNEDPTSWVGLFNHDPAEGFSDPLEKVSTSAYLGGYCRTRRSHKILTGLSYWIDTPLHYSCDPAEWLNHPRVKASTSACLDGYNFPRTTFSGMNLTDSTLDFWHDTQWNSERVEEFSYPLDIGYYRTQISFPRIRFSHKNLTDSSLGFWIGYINKDRLLAKSCIRARPHWMHEMRDIIGSQTLKDIMIPGTHNSGSYEPCGPRSDFFLIPYQMCQEEDIFNQLVFGNRFLDLRVKFANGSEKFWITHGPLMTDNTVRDVLNQVKRFLDNTNEIVIMDFHKLNMVTFEDDRHNELIDLVVGTLGHYMMPTSFGYTTTLNDIWKSNKRLLVGYCAEQRIQSNLLYSEVFHLWGNKDTKEGLEEYLGRKMWQQHNTRQGVWSAMAELTPHGFFFWDSYGSLRIRAQEVNMHITRWFRQRWWQCANIVATDFFLGNNIIDVSIEANTRRFTTS